MKKVNQVLDNKELQNLSTFLREGNYISLIELHGFLTAIISSPNLIMPNEWLEAVELNNIKCISQNEFELIISSLLRFYNGIISDLMAKQYRPLLSVDEHYSFESVEEMLEAAVQWARGYIRAVIWNDENWNFHDEGESTKKSNEPSELATWLFFILALIIEDDKLQYELQIQKQEEDPYEFRQKCIVMLPSVVIKIYDLWHKVRLESSSLIPKKKNKIGRNDLCLCGSNKKYKNCCKNTTI